MSTDARGMDDVETSESRSGASQPAPHMIGETIDGRYRVDALLGEGRTWRRP